MDVAARSSRLEATLEDKYRTRSGWLYLTGMQALVRLPIQQRMRDEAAGLKTGGYISGYRGSPLGRYDLELGAAADALTEHNVVFRAGVNEDLAATALWGTQYVGVFPGARVDGVFGIWYGKGPGVDRSGDPMRHANLAGTGPNGGVLALAGDDHGAKSSTVANYSDSMFVATGIPVLYPSNTQELLDYGLHGIAMSRFSGCWTAMKVVTDVVEGGGSVLVDPEEPLIVIPENATAPEGGRNIRRYDPPLVLEQRLHEHKLHAALAYARANALNRIVLAAPEARLGVVAAGKAYQDLRQALATLGYEDGRELAPLRVLKIGMVWPLDPEIVREFAAGLTTIVVVEEKRPLLEEQVRSILYGIANPPEIVGKHAAGHLFASARGPVVFPNWGEINPAMVIDVIGKTLARTNPELLASGAGEVADSIGAHASGAMVVRQLQRGAPGPMRIPTFCSGCPHNRSTRLPEGSRALAGIGCHSMAALLDPVHTTTMSHMGGEGAMWLGQAPFTDEKHVFTNMGDGTYFHSGFLAIRAAVAAHSNITYKILFNGFVSMTGGQPVDGDLTVERMIHELSAEGVGNIALVSDDPQKYRGVALPAGVQVRGRGDFDAVQRQFRELPDVSVIVYEQPCATERRRLRKRGKWPVATRRAFINSAVCEGCGDCGDVSNCQSIEPLETDLGRKRRINQSSCNQDLTCLEGFCPSFVTIHGAVPRRASGAATRSQEIDFPALPDPVIQELEAPFNVLVAGVGGTGVVTIGQVLAMAAHLEGLFSSNLDVTGLSQKYGAVLSHVRISPEPGMLHATRIAAGEVDTLIGCDLIAAAGDEALAKLAPGRSRGVVAADPLPTAEFARNPDWKLDKSALVTRLAAALGSDPVLCDAQRLASALVGDAIGANMLMLGTAWQLGMIPVSLVAIDRAIELNGVALRLNREAFLWGRRLAVDADAVERHAGANRPAQAAAGPAEVEPLAGLIARRADFLRASRDEPTASRYRELVERVAGAEAAIGGDELARTVAQGYFRVLATKDEFEVARLYSRPEFKAELERGFEGDLRLSFHLGAWPFGRLDPTTGRVRKREFGAWVLPALTVLAKLRFLRDTVLDPFRNTAERKLDRALLTRYEEDVARIVARLAPGNHRAAVELAGLPVKIRGFGAVRERNARATEGEREQLLTALG